MAALQQKFVPVYQNTLFLAYLKYIFHDNLNGFGGSVMIR